MISNKQDKGVFAPNVNLHLGQVAKPAKRGDTRIYVNQLVRNASSAELLFQPGQWYTLALAENAQVRTRQCAGASVAGVTCSAAAACVCWRSILRLQAAAVMPRAQTGVQQPMPGSSNSTAWITAAVA
jgi:hypothetical protein